MLPDSAGAPIVLAVLRWSRQGSSVTPGCAGRCPVTLAMLMEKCREKTGWRWDIAAEKLPGWWELERKVWVMGEMRESPPDTELPLAGTRLPWAQ